MKKILRIIPVLFIKNGHIVRSQNFKQHQVIGNVINQCARYNSWNIDELIYIDISDNKTYDSLRDDHRIKSFKNIEEIVEGISNVCFTPLTFGGGIKSLDDMKVRIYNGADKIIINSLLLDDPKIIESAARTFGSQAIVASLDYKIINGEFFFFKSHGKFKKKIIVKNFLKDLNNMGVGEIFMHSIAKDGTASGFDLQNAKIIKENTSLPVILCGGAGNEFDFLDASESTDVDALAAGNFFHFKELSYINLKRFLKKFKRNVRY